MTCPKFTPVGFRPCSRDIHHEGPCAHWPEFARLSRVEEKPLLKFTNTRCTHDHGDGLIKRELRHITDHWLSCLLSCVVVHLVLDLATFLWSLL